jgi:hypothetical protein
VSTVRHDWGLGEEGAGVAAGHEREVSVGHGALSSAKTPRPRLFERVCDESHKETRTERFSLGVTGAGDSLIQIDLV